VKDGSYVIYYLLDVPKPDIDYVEMFRDRYYGIIWYNYRKGYVKPPLVYVDASKYLSFDRVCSVLKRSSVLALPETFKFLRKEAMNNRIKIGKRVQYF